MGCIIFSSILLAIESPLMDPDSMIFLILGYFDYVMTAIFAVEMVIKIIVFGFLLNGKESYL
jgi:hypothetical protein